MCECGFRMMSGIQSISSPHPSHRLFQEAFKDIDLSVVTHMKNALREMEDSERIKPHSLKQDGKPRRKGTFPDGVIIDFKQ